MKKWKVSVWCEQYDLEAEYVWSIPDDIIEVDSQEEAERLQEEILANGLYDGKVVHRCEIG